MPETPVSKAFVSLKSGLSWDYETEEERNDALEFAYNQLAQLAQATRLETIEDCAKRLDLLGEGRMDYVHSKKPQTSTDIEMMGGVQGMIYGEATGAKWLAKILRGASDQGWLPSWRWGEKA